MVSYFLFYLILLPLSYLPFSVLYRISDLVYLFVYKIIGYRKKVVYSNIKNSFPEKTHQEVKSIEREFYKHLSDLLVESIKTFTISKEESLRRMKIINPEILDNYYQEGKSFVAVGGHNGNWELYAVACAMQINHTVVALYTPLTNKVFDKLFRKSRSRFGLNMIPTRQKEKLKDYIDAPSMITFGIDQCPKRTQRPLWLNFLNQETAVQYGAEKFARDHNLPIVFGNIYKIKRGFYQVELQKVIENPSEHANGEIMAKSTAYLEQAILKAPAHWLWSHKRWKYTKKQYQS